MVSLAVCPQIESWVFLSGNIPFLHPPLLDPSPPTSLASVSLRLALPPSPKVVLKADIAQRVVHIIAAVTVQPHIQQRPTLALQALLPHPQDSLPLSDQAQGHTGPATTTPWDSPRGLLVYQTNMAMSFDQLTFLSTGPIVQHMETPQNRHPTTPDKTLTLLMGRAIEDTGCPGTTSTPTPTPSGPRLASRGNGR